MANNCTVYIGNIPYSTTEAELRSMFGVGGREIRRVSIPIDPQKDNRVKGFAFIEFANVEQAATAVSNFDGVNLNGRTIKVSIAYDRDKKRN